MKTIIYLDQVTNQGQVKENEYFYTDHRDRIIELCLRNVSNEND